MGPEGRLVGHEWGWWPVLIPEINEGVGMPGMREKELAQEKDVLHTISRCLCRWLMRNV